MKIILLQWMSIMRTHEKDVFAVGDCAQKRDFITRKRVSTMLLQQLVLRPE